jgi:1,4-alpha-glucan branching enzyme
MMLDWDLPISQQPKSVQKAFQSIMQKDVSPEGFSWIVGDDAASNILAFARWSDDATPLVSITNFSPVPQEFYSIRMPVAGVWREVLNTDDLKYGGSGITNHSFAVDVDTDLYTTLRVPPLATIWFEKA